MNKFFNQLYFDNTVKEYLISLGIILFVLLLNRLISKYVAGVIFFLVKRIWRNIDRKSFIDLVIHPLGMFVVVFVSMVTLHRLRFPAAWNVDIYGNSFKRYFPCHWEHGTDHFIYLAITSQHRFYRYHS